MINAIASCKFNMKQKTKRSKIEHTKITKRVKFRIKNFARARTCDFQQLKKLNV